MPDLPYSGIGVDEPTEITQLRVVYSREGEKLGKCHVVDHGSHYTTRARSGYDIVLNQITYGARSGSALLEDTSLTSELKPLLSGTSVVRRLQNFPRPRLF